MVISERTATESEIEKISGAAEVCPDCNKHVSYEGVQPVCKNDACSTYLVSYEK